MDEYRIMNDISKTIGRVLKFFELDMYKELRCTRKGATYKVRQEIWGMMMNNDDTWMYKTFGTTAGYNERH